MRFRQEMGYAISATGVCLVSVLLAGCAFDLVHVEQIPSPLLSWNPAKNTFVLVDDVSLALPSGYRRVLKRGTTWTYVGRIAQGDVYRTQDQVLTVEAANVHEAYLVVSAGELTGFYLPVERAFSPAAETRRLPIRELQ